MTFLFIHALLFFFFFFKSLPLLLILFEYILLTWLEAVGVDESAAWISRMEQRRHLYASATGGSSVQRSDSAVADPPPGIAEQPIILPFHWDATKSPSIRAPWRTERT